LLVRFGDEPDLLQQAQGIVVRPFLDDPTVGEPVDGDACCLDVVTSGRAEVFGLAKVSAAAAEAAYYLVAPGYLILDRAMEIGERLATGGSELPGSFQTSYFSARRFVEHVVGGVKLPSGVEISLIAEHLLELSAHQDFIRFGRHRGSPFCRPTFLRLPFVVPQDTSALPGPHHAHGPTFESGA
jgi:hypothetical protein